MHILGDAWQEGYLDYHCGKGQARIQVAAWMVVAPVSGLYVERPRSIRLVWEYLREIGIRATVRKIRSRMDESLRNRRFISVGLGRVAEGSTEPSSEGTAVAFVAPSHPRCVERIVLPSSFIRAVEESLVTRLEGHEGIVWLTRKDEALHLDELSGWQMESGLPVPEEPANSLIEASLDVLGTVNVDEETLLPLATPSPVRERTAPGTSSGMRPSAALFGLGNYAKTVVLGNTDPRVRIARVHEIDPTQLGKASDLPWSVDTSPFVRSDEKYDAYFIAGYHHTHADLAIAAMESGAYAVVEKPVVTSAEQLRRLSETLRQRPGRLFACFHMRYNPLFALAKEDLGVAPGDPVHYYCTVFEIPLPERHWYRWPNSRSHLISNGCHWLDHFLYMNAYARPAEWRIWKCSNGDSQVGVELENGAVMGMHLTHAGSSRIGVRDHLELRANGRTVTVDRGSEYVAESPSRVMRRRHRNKMSAYRTMYANISRKIVAGEPGDSLESFLRTHELALALEELRRDQ